MSSNKRSTQSSPLTNLTTGNRTITQLTEYFSSYKISFLIQILKAHKLRWSDSKGTIPKRQMISILGSLFLDEGLVLPDPVMKKNETGKFLVFYEEAVGDDEEISSGLSSPNKRPSK